MTVERKPKNPAEMYESFFVPAMFEPLSRLLLAAAGPRPGEHALDVACGTGIVARQLATAVGGAGRVAALDLRPGMLEVARVACATNGASIEWHEGNAQALPFPDASFDAVTCQQGLQFFPDRVGALREMKRVSKRGARIVFACWREAELQSMFAEMMELELAHLGGVGLSREDALAPFSLGSAVELERLCTAAGLSGVEIRAETVEASFPSKDFVRNVEFAYAAVMPQFAENPALFDAYVAAVERDSQELRARYTQGDKLVFPLRTHVVRARA